MQKYLKEGKYSYNEDDSLGQGSFGKVYRGYNFHTNNFVALKQIQLSKLETGEDMLKTILLSEITVMRKFTKKMINEPCPFLVKQEDVFRTDKHIYIVMELCSGGTLQDQLRSQRFKQKECIQVIFCICKGLEYMAEMGIVHRDLKPENIFISSIKLGKGEGKQVKVYKIGDFGFAAQKKQFQIAMGTFPYMAPEMFKKEKYSYKVDVWSIGIIAYQIIFGHLYFIGKDRFQIQKSIKEKPFILNEKQSSQISGNYQDFLYRCLNKDPRYRITIEQLMSHPLFTQIQKELTEIERTIFKSTSPQRLPQLNKSTSENRQQDKIFQQSNKPINNEIRSEQYQKYLANKEKNQENNMVPLNIATFSKLHHLLKECQKMRQLAEQFSLLQQRMHRQTQFIQIYLLKDTYAMMNRLTYSIVHKQNYIQMEADEFKSLLQEQSALLYNQFSDKCLIECSLITGLFNQKFKQFKNYIQKFRHEDLQLISKVVNEEPYEQVNSSVFEKQLRKWEFALGNPQYYDWSPIQKQCRRILDMKIKG